MFGTVAVVLKGRQSDIKFGTGKGLDRFTNGGRRYRDTSIPIVRHDIVGVGDDTPVGVAATQTGARKCRSRRGGIRRSSISTIVNVVVLRQGWGRHDQEYGNCRHGRGGGCRALHDRIFLLGFRNQVLLGKFGYVVYFSTSPREKHC